MATTTPSTFSEGERIDYAATLPHQTKLIILGGVLLSLFLAALDQTIVATALPAIVRDFNGIDLVSWVSTGYLLASTSPIGTPRSIRVFSASCSEASMVSGTASVAPIS